MVRRRLPLRPWLLAALAASLPAAGCADRDPSAAAPFPAHTLRRDEAPPDVSGLIAQDGAPLDSAELAGKVVALTSVYACCPAACPALLAGLRAEIDKVPAELRGDLRVLAVSMDPERDTPEALAQLAANFGAGPEWRFLTGPKPRVDAILDEMQVERAWNAETGEIDHEVVVLLVDRAGRLAYRLGAPGGGDEGWHAAAIERLLREPAPRP